MMNNYENSFSYFENHECKYYPCHESEHINCLFCYCPLYTFEDCGGHYQFIKSNGKTVKSCLNCKYPHEKENYTEVIRKLREQIINIENGG